MVSYVPILLMFLISVGFAVTMVIISRIFGKNRPTAAKLMPYECGMNPKGDARERFSVKFYLVAMVFLLFDIEAIFLVPWAISYKGLIDAYGKWFPYFEMMIFIALFLVGYLYVLRKGVLDWGKSKSSD
jgi:NADH-quinone oxidoreductase subunit A